MVAHIAVLVVIGLIILVYGVAILPRLKERQWMSILLVGGVFAWAVIWLQIFKGH